MGARLQSLRGESDLDALARQFDAVEGRNPEGFAALNAVRGSDGKIEDFVYVYLNPAGEMVAGRKNVELRGRRFRQTAHPVMQALFADYCRVVETGEVATRDLDYRSMDGNASVIRVTWIPFGDGFVSRFSDITSQKATAAALRDSHAELVAVLENTSDGFCSLDKDWRFTFVNRRGEKLLRHGKSALLGQCIWDVFPDLQGSAAQRAFFEAQQLRVSRTCELYLAPVQRWFDVRLCPAVSGVSCFLHDITEQRMASGKLRDSEEHFRRLAETIPHIVWTASSSGELDTFNIRWFDYTGMPLAQSRGWGWKSAVHPDDVAKYLDRWTQAVQNAAAFEVECRLRRRDGVYRWHLCRALPVRDPNTKAVKWFGTNTDFDEHQRSEERNRLLVAMIEQAADAMVTVDLEGRLRYGNPAARELLGFSESELEGVTLPSRLTPEDKLRYKEEVRPALMHAGSWKGTLSCVNHKTQEHIPVSHNVFALKDAQRTNVIAYASVTQDLRSQRREEAARHRAEDALQRHEERYRALVAASAQVVWTLTPAGACAEPNPAWTSFTGQTEAETLGMGWLNAFHPDDRERLIKAGRQAATEPSQRTEQEARIHLADGSARWVCVRTLAVVDARGQVIELLGTLSDTHAQHQLDAERAQAVVRVEQAQEQVQQAMKERMRELNEARERLVHAERLRAYGTVISEVRDQLAAPLSSVHAGLERLQDALSGDARPNVNGAAGAVVRAEQELQQQLELLTGLKDLGRPVNEDTAVRLEAVVAAAVAPLQEQLKGRAQLVRDERAVPPVQGELEALKQAVTFMLHHAMESVPPGVPNKHCINVRTRTEANGWACVEVADTGCGVPSGKLAQAFQPGFVLRPGARSTGFGLFAAQSVAAQLGGRMELSSEAGRGSTVRLLLPPADAEASRPVDLPQERGGERPRILVVDDDAAVMHVLERTLSPIYEVVAVQSGEAARAMLGSDPEFDAVMCDLIMPGVNGMDLYDHVTEQCPELLSRFVFVTGGGSTLRSREFLAHVSGPRVSKPFETEEILSTLAGVLA